MNRIIKPGRLLAFVLVIVIVTVIYMVTLYKLQVVEGEAYYQQSQNNVTSSERIPARNTLRSTNTLSTRALAKPARMRK